MEQHAVPRQITTFEFKLIGFMTLKQFLYLVIFTPTAFIVWRIFPIPIINLLLAFIIAGVGVAMAFAKINDRTMDIWLKNLWKRMISPTQYLYKKHNGTLPYLTNLYFVTDPHKVLAHIESQEKLASYLASVQKAVSNGRQHQHIQKLLQKPTHELRPVKPAPAQPKPAVSSPATNTQPLSPVAPVVNATPLTKPVQADARPVTVPAPLPKQPFLIGTIKNSKKIPLPGVLIYVKDGGNKAVRLLKSNPHGIFATYNPLTPGDYNVEIKDPKGTYFFDTMKVTIGNSQPKPLELYSKELL